MQSSANNSPPPTLPTVIRNNDSGVNYIKGKQLGKGGFAYVFEVRETPTNKVFADKIISKDMAKRKSSQEKIRREIFLHRKLFHHNVVRFVETFEDIESIHIIMEYCSMKSLLHLMKSQKVLGEEEVQFYLRQICEGVKYIQQRGIVHRDLKLGNMFLTASHVVKIGDFGLATTVNSTSPNGTSSLCGTPNYIAPEVLQKKGHGFEADVWAIGCMTFAMMSGSPPFETKSLSSTYAKIAANNYTLPSHLSEEAKSLITQLLHPDPGNRGTLHLPNRSDHIVNLSFFSLNFQQQPPQKLNNSSSDLKSSSNQVDSSTSRISPTNQNVGFKASLKEKLSQFFGKDSKDSEAKFLQALITKIEFLLETESYPTRIHNNKYRNSLLVSKWIDYSNKYGFGYQLSDGTTGVLFNDRVRICENKNRRSMEVVDEKGTFHTCNYHNVPSKYAHYAKILEHFDRYMEDNLADGKCSEAAELPDSKLTQVVYWSRNDMSVVMLLSNGSLQINFFHNHEKLLFWQQNSQFFVTLIGQNLTLNLSPPQTSSSSPQLHGAHMMTTNPHQDLPIDFGVTLKSCSTELQMFRWEIGKFLSLS